jgi:hypothetical protein
MLHVEVDGVELVGHEIALLEPDAVLAREHAADVDAKLQDLVAELLGFGELLRVVRVEKNRRM